MKTYVYESLPYISIILLTIGVIWLLKDLGYININIPWWPVIFIIIGVLGVLKFVNKKISFP